MRAEVQMRNGFSLVELLVSMVILLLVMASVTALMIHSSRLSKSYQARAELQSNARGCLTMVEEQLRSAGWDPHNVGFDALQLDPDLTDPVSQIEVFADLNEDGDTDDEDEAVLIRHIDDRVEWRRSTASAFVTLATNISNDADGDGTPEPMFEQDPVDPAKIAVKITAQSRVPDLRTGDYLRYTVRSTTAIREAL